MTIETLFQCYVMIGILYGAVSATILAYKGRKVATVMTVFLILSLTWIFMLPYDVYVFIKKSFRRVTS